MLPSHLIDARSRPTFYMPHIHVIRKSSLTTKMRVVFNVSSHANACKSLDECLETGLNLNPDLLHMLLRFRWHPCAVTADIEKVLRQVGVTEEVRDAFRSLWFAAERSFPMKKEDIQGYRMTRVPFGLTSSPFFFYYYSTAGLENGLSTAKTGSRYFTRPLLRR